MDKNKIIIIDKKKKLTYEHWIIGDIDYVTIYNDLHLFIRREAIRQIHDHLGEPGNSQSQRIVFSIANRGNPNELPVPFWNSFDQFNRETDAIRLILYNSHGDVASNDSMNLPTSTSQPHLRDLPKFEL